MGVARHGLLTGCNVTANKEWCDNSPMSESRVDYERRNVEYGYSGDLLRLSQYGLAVRGDNSTRPRPLHVPQVFCSPFCHPTPTLVDLLCLCCDSRLYQVQRTLHWDVLCHVATGPMFCFFLCFPGGHSDPLLQPCPGPITGQQACSPRSYLPLSTPG